MTGASRHAAAFPWLVVIAVLAVSLTMRAPILAVSPVVRAVQADTGVGATTVSLLTTMPVIAFALLTPLAALLLRRLTLEIALLGCLFAVVAGTMLRALPGFGWLVTGMTVIGVGLTVGNIVLPVIIRRDVPARAVTAVTAGYAALVNVGSLIVTFGTAPLAELVGWSNALLSWIWMTLLALVIWLVHMWRRRLSHATADESPTPTEEELLLTGPVPTLGATGRSAFRSGVLWLLTGTFCAQSASYYAISTWLPTLLGDTAGVDAAQAGALASLFQGAGIVGALLVPVLTLRMPVHIPAILVSVAWMALSAGLLFAPTVYPLWMIIGGIAQGGGFVVVMTVLVRYCRSDAEAATGSALVQGGGYLVAALGAPVMGALHESTGGWPVPLAVTLAVAVGFGVFLLSAIVRARAEGRS